MATVGKVAWMQRVDTVLTGITVAGGYRTTVARVEPMIKTWEEVGRGITPFVGYGIATTISEPYYPGNQIRCVATLNIVAHVSEADADAALVALGNLEDDILGALMEEPTLDGNAIDIKWRSTQDDVQDPHASTVTRGGRGSMLMEFEVTWDRTGARTP